MLYKFFGVDMGANSCSAMFYHYPSPPVELDDIEVFEEQMLSHFREVASRLDIPPSFIFARLIPGSSVVAAINWRVLCDRCYPEFARARGKTPRPDIYIMHLERRGKTPR